MTPRACAITGINGACTQYRSRSCILLPADGPRRRRVPRPFLGEHWPITFHPKWKALDNSSEKVLTSFYGYKRHRRGLAIAPRGFVLTSAVRSGLMEGGAGAVGTVRSRSSPGSALGLAKRP